MKRPSLPKSRIISLLCGLLVFLEAPTLLLSEPSPSAVSTFNLYSRSIEARLAQQHRSQRTFLAAGAYDPQTEARLRKGELIVEQITPPASALPGSLPGALLHHWRGTAFAPGAKADDFERLMRDFSHYPQYFSPQVLQARSAQQPGGRLQVSMRIRQRHVITIVMDTTYDITFGQLDVKHGYSISQSTHIDEIVSAGTATEHVLSQDEEHGFLWRLNTYWSYEERDGGLYMQIESVSLTRSIPHGLGWAVQPFVESVPRESLEFTLRSACNALHKS